MGQAKADGGRTADPPARDRDEGCCAQIISFGRNFVQSVESRPAAHQRQLRLAWAGLAVLAGCSIVPWPAAAQSVTDTTSSDARSRDDTGPYIHIGPGALIFDADAKVRSGGALLPGATVSIDPNPTVITEFGYRWRHFGVSLTGGVPPLATVKGAGTLASLGNLGRIRYGPAVFTAHYHFTGLGRLEPYVGGGAVLLLIFDNQDGAVTRLKVGNHWGAALQAGAEYRIAPRLSLYLDVKKAALKTNATALLNGAPIEANIRLNPTVVSGGLSVRF